MKKLPLLVFLGCYALLSVSLLASRGAPGWWWVLPAAGLLGMISMVILVESRADEVVRSVVHRAYQVGFWILITYMLVARFAAIGGATVNTDFAWALGLGAWVIIYVAGLWRLR